LRKTIKSLISALETTEKIKQKLGNPATDYGVFNLLITNQAERIGDSNQFRTGTGTGVKPTLDHRDDTQHKKPIPVSIGTENI
jgi:hypothetical protein